MPTTAVYRPAARDNLLVAASAALFLALAVGCFWQGDSRTQLLGYPLSLVGVCVAAVSVARFRTRIVVTAEGLSRVPAFPNGFAFRWDDVQSWAVVRNERVHRDRLTTIAAQFTLGGDRRPVQVTEDDASRPDFDTFLRHVRQFLGGREQP